MYKCHPSCLNTELCASSLSSWHWHPYKANLGQIISVTQIITFTRGFGPSICSYFVSPRLMTNRFILFLDEWLVLPKLLYLALNMFVYSTYYFTINYFKDVWNIPVHAYGIIAGLTTIGFFGSILWTILADRTGRHKTILLLTALGFWASFSALRLELVNPQTSGYWSKMIYVSCLYGLSNLFISAMYPLLDDRIFALLMTNPKFSTKLYGKQRLWGSIGQAIITQLNAYGIQSRLHYDILFINLSWTSTLFMVLVIFGIPSHLPSKRVEKVKDESKEVIPLDTTILSSGNIQMYDSKQEDKSVFTPALRLLSKAQFWFFIALILSAGYVRSILGHYLVYYFENTVRQKADIYTYAMQMRLISEISLFFVGRPLLNKFGSFWIMMIGLLTGTLRVTGYALIPPTKKWSYSAFGLEILKGVNNACIVTSGVRIAHQLAPPGCEATAQGFFSGIQSSLANAIAGIVGGLILKIYEDDPHKVIKLFMHTSIFSFLICCIYGLQQYFWPFPTD